jgi:hypothetical protein
MVTAIAAVMVAFIAGEQWTASRQAANAAIDAAKTAREALQVDERPWVFATDVHLMEPIAQGRQNHVEFTYANSGKTPALNLTVTANFSDWSPWPAPDNAPVVPTGGMEIARELLPNGVFHTRGGDIPPRNQSQFGDLASGKAVFSLMGNIQYQDVFRDWHRTHFCYFVERLKSADMILCPNNNYVEDINVDGTVKNK